jgi:hypothetical protein
MIAAGFIVWLAGLFWLRIITLLWLWNWFIMPFGNDMISFWHAAGLTAIVTFFTFNIPKKADLQTNTEKAMVFFTPYISNATVLLLGYLYQLGM